MTDSSSKSPPPPKPPAPFKSGREAIKALRAIAMPITDVARLEFIDRIKRSSDARLVVFGMLVIERREKLDARWGSMRGVVRQILIGDAPLPERKIFVDPVQRRSWLAGEFGTGYRSEDAKAFLSSGGYLRPLYLLLNEPDSLDWLPQALGEFRDELLGAEEVAKNAKPRPKRLRSMLGEQVAAHLTGELTQGKTRGIKALKRDLKLIELLCERDGYLKDALDDARRQIGLVGRRLEESTQLVAETETRYEAQKEQNQDLRTQIQTLEKEVAQSRDRVTVQRAVVETKSTEQLNAQRAAIQSYMSEKLGNVKLYADRPEPAREKILRLCDEMVAFLENPSR